MSQFPADRPEIPRLPSQSSTPLPQTRAGELPLYKVVLHRGVADDLMHVVRCVMELTRFPRAEATHRMWQAHHAGRSVVLLTHRERAELFAELFAARGLVVSVEPA